MMKILRKIFILIVLSQQIRGEYSSFCVCSQIQDNEQCDRSIICQWIQNKCIIKNGERYLDKGSVGVYCKEYSQEDCRLQDKCGFYLGECIDFKECQVFKREECWESSQNCISDGMKCINIGQCEEYENWITCQNKNKANRYCFWSISENPKCRISRECNELPMYLTSDLECREQISICTVSVNGGCVESEEQCTMIKYQGQCFYNKDKSQQCYWDQVLSQCVDLLCSNLRFKSDQECRSLLQECTTNGQQCILRQECKDSLVIEGCVTDIYGNKCIFINNECKKKECSLAEDVNIYQNYNQYCVFKNGGGCKNRPINCEDYDGEEDCLSIKNQQCFWMNNNNQCKKQGCESQLLSLNHNQCKIIGKCMGNINGGCQDRPQTCNLINYSQFCDVDYFNRKCYWNTNICVENICSNFIFPQFSSHLQCNIINNKCTYDYYHGICLDYTCETLHQNDCLTNQLCKLPKKCKLKQCSDAPISLINHTDCQLWLNNCTVNVYQLSNIQQIHGCTLKKLNCNDYHQQQCYSTIDDYQCKWNSGICIPKVCSDYINSSSTFCQNLKVVGMKCIINSSNTACIQWPTICSGFSDLSQCSLGLIDGTSCLWNGTSCIFKACNLSSGQSTNYQCKQWNQICNYDISTSQCKERDVFDTCGMTVTFTIQNHQECNSWNNSCTVNTAGAIGCQRKQYSCLGYNTQQKCSEDYYGVKCQWNTSTNQCFNYIPSSCPMVLNLAITNQMCEQISISCVNQNIACELLKTDCSLYVFEMQCKINSYYEPCVWNGTSCLSMQCQSQTTANNDSDCFNYFNSSKNCQQKINANGMREQGCEIMDYCSSIISQQKCDQSVSRNQVSCKFISGVCQEFHQNNNQNCHLNISATSNYECKQINDICELNYRDGIGCTAQQCNLITNSSICILQKPKGTSCSWNSSGNLCQTNSCSFYTINSICIQQYEEYNIKCYWCDNRCINSNYCQEVIMDYHKECNNKNQLNTVAQIQTCASAQSGCVNYSAYSSCKYSLNRTKCIFQWSISGASLPTTGLCNDLCSSFSSQISCQANSKYCQWISSLCTSHLINCSDYLLADCDTAITRSGTKCTIDTSAQCVQRICQNYKNGTSRIPSNQSDCDNWLDNCLFIGNKCIDACQLASFSSVSITQCEQYRPNKVCTIGDEPKCGSFVQQCSQAQQSQCYFDANKQKCYWNTVLQKCFELNSCDIIDTSNDTHIKCNTLLSTCTVNDSQNGCIELKDCHQYYNSYQCYFNRNYDPCIWDIDKCITIQCNYYLSESICENSTLNTKCIWDHINLKCIVLDCNNIIIDQNHSCLDYTKYCINESCKTIECEDFQYDNDNQCQQIFTDKHCISDGQSCLQRLNCQDCHYQICCNFDRNLNDCIWISGQCYDRNCNSMPIIPFTYDECIAVQIECTIKSQGGCQLKTNCNFYKDESECLIDLNEYNCIWEQSLQQCFSDMCQSLCGDGLVTYPYEECDDTNNLPYDGCYECKIQCSLGCLICESQVCLKCNPLGWIYNQNTQQCDSICGDGIITILEKCDDGNFIQYDGCYECDYQCSIECLNCYQGICQECPFGFYPYNSNCNTQCGDGIVIIEKEECDDSNLYNHDGCNNKCQIENNWKCIIQDQLSHCFQQDYPIPLLQMINNKPNHLLLAFTQPIMLSQSIYNSDDFIKSISITILKIDKKQFNFTLIPIIELSKELMDIQYTIDLQFQVSIKNPILNLSFDSYLIINELGNNPSSNITIKLSNIEQLTNLQKTITDKATQFNTIVIYIIIGIAILSIFLGNFEIFWNLLDNLQQLSYIKYININYPINFQVFLAIFDLVSLQPLQNYLQLDQIFGKVMQQNTPKIQYNIGKFEFFETECFFGTNLQSFIIILLTSIINYWISKLFIKLLIKSKYSNLINHFDGFIKCTIQKLVTFLYSLQSLALLYIKSFFYQGLIRIYLSSYYDLTFSSLLQMVTFSQSSILLQICSALSIVIFAFNLISILGFYSQSLISHKIIKLKMFFQGINTKSNKWNAQYQTILLIKKITFICALILLQVIPICQTLFISFQSVIFTLYIILSKPMYQSYENLKIIIFETSIYLNCILFLCHNMDYFYQYRIQIGWANIILFSVNLIGCLIVDILQQFKILKSKLCKPVSRVKKQINPNLFVKC
ncbi:unnamed protein product [Paramecium primaurelia]|uniref:PSI domain-containing protein n=1 Tax=Paramecium primaurelia TaxID=5886 RepID=A0A8S1MWP9_PARPR|nr:unnamed protein product [Paramecium primaurelia]